MQTAPRFLQALSLLLLITLAAGDALAQRGKKEENEFPNATRAEPRSLKVSEGNSKKINEAYDLLDQGEDEKAREVLQSILDNPRSSPYEKALCLQGLAQVLYNQDDIAGAVETNEKALALDSLDNKSHFNLVYQVAQMNLMDERYDAALAAVERWIALTGKETAEAMALKGNALYRLERFPEASAAMSKAIALSPEPSDTWQQLLVASYYDAENFTGSVAAAEAALADGADLEGRDARGRTALLLAATEDRVEVARMLVARGADVDALDGRHDTPFLVTGVTGSVAMLEALLPGRPDTRIRNRYGGVAVIPASERGHAEYVEAVLRLTDIDVDHVNDLGWTALLEAVILGDGGPRHQAVVRALLAAGADRSIADRDGVTPLEHAQRRGQDAVAALLR